MKTTGKCNMWLLLLFIVTAYSSYAQPGGDPAYSKRLIASFRYTDMTGGPSQRVIMKSNSTALQCDAGTFSARSAVKKASLNVLFNWNNDFQSGSVTNQYSLTYTLTGYSSNPSTAGATTASNVVVTYTANLVITNGKPQAYVNIDITSLYNSLIWFDVKPALTPTTISHSQVNGTVVSDVSYVEEFETDASGATVSPVGLSVTGNNLIKFSWAPSCVNAGSPPNYQFQLLKLWNNSSSTISNDNSITATIDWNQALSIETGNSKSELELTMAEGVGYYIWRVRAIGDAFEGGIANDRNWGPWSSTGTYTQSATSAISAGVSPYLFYFSYNQFDFYNPTSAFNTGLYPGSSSYSASHDGNRNWIFTRNFVEGDATTKGQVTIGESISYANHLQMSNQQQSRILSEGKKLISQSIYDYSGRQAMSVLPAPVIKKTLSYEPAFIKNPGGNAYSAYDFDHSFTFDPGNVNYLNAKAMDSTATVSDVQTPSNYYSDNNQTEDNIPTAQGYPFSRTLFSKDGKNTAIESSMPGKTHQINNTSNKHTMRHLQSGVADMELIRIFGDEAPDENTVFKTISIDPNNSASVTYVSKEGKTIATCLSSPGASNLNALPSAAANSFSVSSNIVDNNAAAGDYAFRAFKTLALTEPANVSLTYSLAPNSYSVSECNPTCTTCDYKITFRVTDNNGEMAPITTTAVVTPGGGCSASVVTSVSTITLQAGEYTIERIIEANTAPSGSSTTYLNSFIQAVGISLSNDLLGGTGVVVDDSNHPTGAPGVTIQTVLDYIEANDLQTLYEYLGVEEGKTTHVNVKIGCNTIRIPVWPCTKHDCKREDQDFEKYLYDWFGINPKDNEAENTKLQEMFASQGYVLGDFNTVIQNMLSEGYNCEKLWQCWQGTVAMFAAQTNSNNPQATPVVSIPGTSASFSPIATNYLDQFLNCTGYKMEGIRNTPGDGYTEGYKTHPFKWFAYTSQCCACELAMASSYVSCGGSIPSGYPGDVSLPACGSDINDFINWFNDPGTSAINLPCAATGTNVLSTNKDAFYKCILNNLNTTATGGIDPCSINSGLVNAVQEGVNTNLLGECNARCEALYNEFVSMSKYQFHHQGFQVQGDAWELVQLETGGYEEGPRPYTGSESEVPLLSVYCQADILLAACKQDCKNYVSKAVEGDFASIQTIQNMFTSQYVLAPYSREEGRCPEGFTEARSKEDSLVTSIRLLLNQELAHQRQIAGSDGIWWDVTSFIYSVSPTYAAYFSNPKVILVHPDIPSYFGLTPGVSTGNRIAYYFNKNQNSAGTIPVKTICSESLIGASANFIYAAALPVPTATIIANSSPAYIFSPGFEPYAAVASATIMPLVNALLEAQTNTVNPTFPIDVEQELYTYTINHELGVEGYWVYDMCREDIQGTNKMCDARICYKVQPATVDTSLVDVLDFSPLSCEAQTLRDIANSINNQLSVILSDYAATIKNNYKEKCLSNLKDYYKAGYSLKYHHYTLYYYDRAGNLVKTVPPAGVAVTSANRLTHPAHAMVTEYEYNSLSQLVRQKTPDGGESRFWYDAKGKMRFSQNAKQLPGNKYSYTKYDELSRIVEVGEIVSGTVPSFALINTLNYPAAGSGTDITRTVYTESSSVLYFGNRPQRFLQNRVSYSFTDVDGNIATKGDQVLTYYSYDPHGNVEWLIQDIPELGRNYMAYEYDLASGSVIKVKYNEAFADRFYHRYTYDAEKRLKTTETSTDGIYWEKDAAYNYYLHGPLKRTVVGHEQVQGLDYVYTIHGWLKTMNGYTQYADPGGDGSLADHNMYVARDAYAMVLGYYDGDYHSKTAPYNSQSIFGSFASTGLYNGNISSWQQVYDQKAFDAVALSNFAYGTQRTTKTFKYDELNRLAEAKFLVQNASTNTYSVMSDYQEGFSYDANGNIINLNRNGRASALQMDNLTYYYYNQAGTIYAPSLMAPAPNTDISNRLAYVTDAVPTTSAYTDDIENQASTTNYTYDNIGNLTSDVAEGITSITWNVYGKIASIKKTVAAVTTTLTFLYDAGGNRVYKKLEKNGSPVLGDNTTYYVKDASGNSMAVYERTNRGAPTSYTADITVKERPVYGSERLGIKNNSITRSMTFSSTVPPVAQVAPTVYHTGSYPALMLPLGNNISKQVFSRDIYTVPSGSLVVNGVDYLLTVSGASAAVTYEHENSQAMVHDESGNVILSAYAYKVYTSGVYSYQRTAIYLKDKLTVSVPTDLNNAADGQAVFMKKPFSSDEYYLFTMGTDGKPYYHTIDATVGQITNYNTPLDNNADYGKTLALLEDRVGEGNSTLYLKRFYGGNAYIKPVAITETGFNLLPDVLIGGAVSTTTLGEMQVSAGGTRFAVVSDKSSTVGELKLYNLSVNHQTLTAIASRTFTGNSRSVEFSNNDVSVFFTAKTGSTTTMQRLPVATFSTTAATTMHTQSVTAVAGSIRKGVNGQIYYLTTSTATPTVCTITMFTNPDAATTSVNTVISSTSKGNLPVQPHLLAYQPVATSVLVYNRELDKKEYELKDHLGNVHATVKDYKVAYNGTSDVSYDERFDNATTGSFTLMAGAPASSTVTNVNGAMSVLSGASTGATARALIPITSAGQYIVSFDYSTTSPTLTTYGLVPNALDGSSTYYIDGISRHNFVVNMPAGAANIDLRFASYGAGSNVDFSIDNLLIKKLDESNINTISVVRDEDYETNVGDWIATNTNIGLTNYFPGTQLYMANAYSGNPQYIKKIVNVIPDQLYKVSMDVSSTDMTFLQVEFSIANRDGTKQKIMIPNNDPVMVTYTFYVIPRTNQLDFYLAPSDSNAPEDYSIFLDNFKMEHVANPTNPLYIAVMNNATDYYAFGSPMPGRNFTSGNRYRYTFNGKEEDPETVGTAGGTQDYGMRIYNPSLGRFLSVDPLASSYPWNSTYAFCENRPIDGTDLEGGEYLSYLYKQTKTGAVLILKTDYTKTWDGQGSRGPGILVTVIGMDGKVHEQFIKAAPSAWDKFKASYLAKAWQLERATSKGTEVDSNPNLSDQKEDRHDDKAGGAPSEADKPYVDPTDPSIQKSENKTIKDKPVAEEEKSIEQIVEKKGDSVDLILNTYPKKTTIRYDKSENQYADPAPSNDRFNGRVIKDGTKDKMYKKAEKLMKERRKANNES